MPPKTLTASTVSRQLGDAGFHSAASARGDYQDTNERGYRSTKVGDAIHVRFIGRPTDDDSMITVYRNVLENLGYTVATLNDPDRVGRWLLKVTR